jgi:argininosuccinate lyase
MLSPTTMKEPHCMPPLDDLNRRYWQALADAAAAHAIMLHDIAVVDEGLLGSLLLAIDRARGAQPPALAFALFAAKLDERIDSTTAPGALGAAQVGRGQADLAATAARLVLRDRLLGLLPQLLRFREVMDEFSGSHAVTLMAAQAHAYGAQATTLGHVASALVASLERASTALIAALSDINQSPLGAGMLSGVGVSIDRTRSAGLLGMPKNIDQTYDAIAGVDHLHALADGIERVAAPVTRWLDELLVMVRADPETFALDATWQVTEVLAPQWQAAGGIAALAAHGRRVAGEAATLRSVVSHLPWGPVIGEVGSYLTVADTAIGNLDVLIERSTFLMERALLVNRAALANRAGRAFVTVGDLGDFLMIEEQIEPAAARTIAGMAFTRARDAGLEASGITPEMIDTAAMLVIGREIKVEFEAISKYLAPRRFIERRNQSGGPAPSAVRSWLAGATRRRQADAEWIEQLQSAIEQAAAERNAALAGAVEAETAG